MIKKKIIIDTDFGGDPDDIIALAYAFKSQELDIQCFITSDEYELNHRGISLINILRSIGNYTPVYYGKDLGNKKFFLLQRFVQRDIEIENVFTSTQFLKLLKAVNDSHGYYLSIGGLTNLSILLKKDPEYFKHMRIYIMGGSFHFERIEHNIGLDLKAAQKVCKSHANLYWTLADHTFSKKIRLTQNHRLTLFYKKRNDILSQAIFHNLSIFYKKFYPESYLHDPLTLSAIMIHNIKFKLKKALINNKGRFILNGSMLRHYYSEKVDYSLFLKDLQSKLDY